MGFSAIFSTLVHQIDLIMHTMMELSSPYLCSAISMPNQHYHAKDLGYESMILILPGWICLILQIMIVLGAPTDLVTYLPVHVYLSAFMNNLNCQVSFTSEDSLLASLFQYEKVG